MGETVTATGAETVRWDLSDLFQSPDDPKIEATLSDALQRAKGFESKYKGKVATLDPKPFAAMMRELEVYEDESVKPDVYAYMRHSQNREDHAASHLLARGREVSTDLAIHL